MINRKSKTSVCVAAGVMYFILSFLLSGKYGITLDEPLIYNAGELHLEYLLTGKKELLESHQDTQKKLAALNLRQHPWHKESANGPYNHPQITPLLSAISCKIFFQKLDWLNSIDAHHLPLIIISSAGVFILVFFIYSETSNIFLALCSGLFLGLFPRFFSLSHTNPTDASSLVAILTAAVLFYKAFKSPPNLYLLIAASFFLGVNFAVKPNAVITVAAVLCWLVIERKGRLWNKSWGINEIFILLVYFFAAFIVFMSGHPYYWSMTSPSEIFTKTVELINYEKGWGTGGASSWNFSQLFVLFAVTPPIMIFTFPLGLFYFYKRHRSLFFLFFFLFFWSLMRTCIPYAMNFDGIRHYIEVAIPLAVFSAAGVAFWTDWLSEKFSSFVSSIRINLLSIVIVLTCMGYAVYKYFPYENVYFNRLVGGAKGAFYNPRLTFFHGDYWQTSSREVVEWLNSNAEKNSQVYDLIGISRYYHDPDDPDSFLRRDSTFPKDHKCTGEALSNTVLKGMTILNIINQVKNKRPDFIKQPGCFMGNGYMIITNLRQPYHWNALYQTLILNGDRVVKTIERDGYPIAYIVKANVIVVYDNSDIYGTKTPEALHFDLGSNKVWISNK